ncbi:MAG: ATP-binding cassette domain-containing protein [Thiotrichales bacterium]|nr:MAG: ATP-binding cassette domain-containing protein [Thiotrichales bacterium]
MSSQALISVNNLTRYYGDNCAVNDISFELAAGDILGFLGPNGAGKSTTMQMLSGNLAPSRGEILINGIDLLDRPGAAKSALGYLPEVPPLYREMNVDEYLRYCAKLRRISKAGIGDAMELAKLRCGLTAVGKRLIGNLSKGFQQRVGIAQAILHSPQIIILDEPTVGLDPIQIREIRELITELGESHGIILSTHILPEVESVCNRVQIINAGKLVYASDMKDLLEQHATGRFEISLGNPPGVDELRATDLIDSVEQLDANSFIVHITSTADRLAAVAVNNNWELRKLVAHEHSLEHIFVNLTLGDEEIV